LKNLKDRVEAILFSANRPLSLNNLIDLFEVEDEEKKSKIISALFQVKKDYEGKAVELIEVASGYRFQIKQDFSEDVAKLWEVKPLKLSRATLETISIIAYMQPVTRGDIEEIRGVSVATSVVKLLIDQGWAKIKGYRDVPGRPALFITTQKFLDDFSLKSLSELPELPNLPDVLSIDPELSLQNDVDAERSKNI
jgi:segregation and condensation protein B|tara:strand:- start:18323 stop:18907 length:585 start_codon:yes stop_codon:yes gene_type:complete